MKLNANTLQPAERAEFDAALAAPLRPGDTPKGPAGFLLDNDDIIALWLFLLFAGAGGIGVYFFGGLPVPYAREALLLTGLGLIAWTISTWVRTHRKRGCLFTSFGTFLVRGSKLNGLRHTEVKAIKCRTIQRRVGAFTVFELVGNDESEVTMYAHGRWAQAAIAAIQKARGGVIPVSER